MLPKQPSKVSGKDLAHLDRVDFSFFGEIRKEPAFYTLDEDGFKYELIVNPRPEAGERIFVFFSGDALRKKFQIPVFQRWSWSDRFPGHTVYISDPTLHLDESLSLAWYLGNERRDVLPTIARIIRKIAADLRVPLSSVYTYGSSGGGFTALRTALFLEDIGVIAINPQIDVTEYSDFTVEKMLRLCFPGNSRAEARQRLPDRLNLNRHVGQLSGHRIIYVQNLSDEHHFQRHFTPFREALQEVHRSGAAKGSFDVVHFSDSKGHSAAEPPETLAEVIEILKKAEYAAN